MVEVAILDCTLARWALALRWMMRPWWCIWSVLESQRCRLRLCLWSCQTRMLPAALIELVQMHARCATSRPAKDAASVGPEPIVPTYVKGRSGRFTRYFALCTLFPANQQGCAWLRCCYRKRKNCLASSMLSWKSTMIAMTRSTSSQFGDQFLEQTTLKAFAVVFCQGSLWTTGPSPFICTVEWASWVMDQQTMLVWPTCLELQSRPLGGGLWWQWSPDPGRETLDLPIQTMSTLKWRTLMMSMSWFGSTV